MGLFRALSYGRRTGTRGFYSNSQRALQRSLTEEKKEEAQTKGQTIGPTEKWMDSSRGHGTRRLWGWLALAERETL